MKKIFLWILQIIPAVILVMAAVPKLTGDPQSIQLFTQLGIEPTGRVITGVLEMIAAILLLVPFSGSYGAILAAGLMTGAILAHATKIGFRGDLLLMFLMAVAVFACSAIVLFLRRRQLPFIHNMFCRAPDDGRA
jgi:uncharacterized membrane protein YphA (DoxX/SURF4 family)